MYCSPLHFCLYSHCYIHVNFFLSFRTQLRITACVLPSSTNRHMEANKMFTEAIQKLKDMRRPLHLTLEEGNEGEPSQAY
jgi:hypothetical protein